MTRMAPRIKTAPSITRMLDEAVRSHPDKTFLRTADGELTYRQARDAVVRLAGGLEASGIHRHSTVAVLMHNSLEQVITWCALARIGALHAPVNTALVGNSLRHVLLTAGATAVVADDSLSGALIDLVPSMPKLKPVVIYRTSEAPAHEMLAATIDLAELMAHPGGHEAAEAADLATATLLFTSGTTGPSKACSLSHRYLARQGQIHARQFEFVADDVLYSPFPLFHIDAATLTVVSALATGCTAALGRRFSASRFWEEVRSFDASVFNFMGATLTILWKQASSGDDRRHRVRMGWGVPMPPWQAEWEQRFGFPLFQVYGSTDAGLPVYDPIDGTQRPGACGRVIDEFDVRIADSLDLPDAPGEILVRGKKPGLTMTGYHAMPDATTEVIDRDGWIHTGDVGTLDADGYLTFNGRSTDSIRRRGENISAFEVEEMVLSHPDVLEAAAVGVASELTEEDIKISVVLRPGAAVTPTEIHAHCLERAPHFMVPRYIDIRPELPKTPTQKVEKFKLRESAEDLWDAEREKQSTSMPQCARRRFRR